MRIGGVAGVSFAACVIAASLLTSSPGIPVSVEYPLLVHASIGLFSAWAFVMLQRQLKRLSRQPAWGRGWDMAGAGCLALAGACILSSLQPMLSCDTQPAMAAGAAIFGLGLGIVAFDLLCIRGGIPA